MPPNNRKSYGYMAKIRQESVKQIEEALDWGTFIPYSWVGDFVYRLGEVQTKIDSFLQHGKAKQNVYLYEIFLSGCYEKAEEIDDSSGELGLFFEQLFCSWIDARQKVKCDPRETIRQVLAWIENDEYGFCYNIEKSIVNIFGSKELEIFESAIKSRFEEVYNLENPKEVKRIYEYPYQVRKNTEILKIIYNEKKDIKSYLDLCDKVGITPKDCEAIALLYKSANNFLEAFKPIFRIVSWKNWNGRFSFCFVDDGGRPPETGIQVLVPNRLQVLPSKAVVLSGLGKG